MQSKYGSIRKKTFLLLLILTISVVFISSFSYVKLYTIRKNFNTLYLNNIYPVIKAEEIRDIYKVDITQTLKELHKGTLTFQEAQETVLQSEEFIENYWKEYKKSLNAIGEFTLLDIFVDGEDFSCSKESDDFPERLIDEIDLKQKESFKGISTVLSLFSKGEIGESRSFFENDFLSLINSLDQLFTQLINYELECIPLLKSRMDKSFEEVFLWMFLISGFIIIISIWFSYRIMKNIECIVTQSEEIKIEKERELQNLRRELEERIQKEVKKSRDKDQIMFQQARLASMGEMIGNIAHQWRQPLNALTILIQSFATKQMMGTLTEEFVEKQVEEGVKIAKSMSQTLEDFRNFYKPNRKKEVFSIKQAVENAYMFVRSFCAKEGIDVKIECHKDIQILGYQNEFTQVILNLFNNARDNFKERDIENKKILIKIERKTTPMPIAFIIFIDNGGGIDPKIIDRVFEPYFTTKHQSAGTGIGLYMSKQIIEMQMEGKIIVKNTTRKFEDGISYKCAQFIIAIPIK